MTKKIILQLKKDGCIPQGRAKLPQGETVPSPSKDYIIVFKDYFSCGLRLPSVKFLREVLEEFDVQIDRLTPNGFLTLGKCCWAYKSYGAELDLDTFCTYYELQR
jgi:hypothetical protein